METTRAQKFYLAIYLFLCVATTTALLLLGWTEFWKLLKIPTFYPEFADMRTVQGAPLSLRDGFNPQANNPGDPHGGRPMNYPWIWLTIGEIFAFEEESNFILFNIVSIVIFLIACGYLLWTSPSFWLLLSIFSSATLLGVERGNNDIIVFSLLLLFSTIKQSGSIIPFAAACALKIYPVFSLNAIFVYKSKPFFTAALAVSLCVILFNLDGLHHMQVGNSGAGILSYGVKSFFGLADKYSDHEKAIKVIYFIFLALIVFSTIKFKFHETLKAHQYCERDFHLFLVGASIYAWTSIFAANWDYRLIFLILTVPYISKIKSNWFLFFYLGMVIISMNVLWLGSVSEYGAAALSIFAKNFLLAVTISSLLRFALESFLNTFSPRGKLRVKS